MDHILGNKADWKATKKKYLIPDKICPFSIGEKLDAFDKLLHRSQGASTNSR